MLKPTSLPVKVQTNHPVDFLFCDSELSEHIDELEQSVNNIQMVHKIESIGEYVFFLQSILPN